MADLPLPPPKRNPDPIYHLLPTGSQLTRLFNPNSFGATATDFRAYGPLSRFDHHRQSAGGGAAHDIARRILYAAPTLSSCLVEVFGDTGIIETNAFQVAFLTTTRVLRLLDLCGSGAMRAGTISAVCKDGRRPRTQAWARYFYEDAIFWDSNSTKIDGLRYANAHNDETAVALFESCETALICAPGDVVPLNSSALRPILIAIANDHNMIISP